MTPRMRLSLATASCTVTLVATAAAPARAATAVSNMDNPDPVGYAHLLEAVSFTTGDQPSVLTSISARYFCTSSTFGMDILGSLRADAGGSPGPVIETFPEQTGPAGHGVVAFPSAGTPLAPHTTYWLYLGTPTATFWETTTLLTESSDYGWSIGDQLHYADVPGAGRFSIDATILPEPSAVILASTSAALMPFRRRPRSGACR